MGNSLVRTTEGTRYLNEVYKSQSKEEDDLVDLSILIWAGHKRYPLVPEKLALPESRVSVRRLFEAGYLKYGE